MIKLFADLTNQRFATGLRDRSEPLPYISQNNAAPVRLYLLRPLNANTWPFAYDPLSGAADQTAILSLRNLAGFPVTLASTEPLTPIKNGFQGTLRTHTTEIAAFLAGRAEREAALCLDLIDADGNQFNPFQRAVTLRSLDAGLSTPVAGFFYFPEITGYAGGGATNLDAKSTVGRALGTIFMAVINGILAQWRLESGTADTDLDLGIIKPLDFHAVSNPVNLVRVGGI